MLVAKNASVTLWSFLSGSKRVGEVEEEAGGRPPLQPRGRRRTRAQQDGTGAGPPGAYPTNCKLQILVYKYL
jgi:hypothetical protein